MELKYKIYNFYMYYIKRIKFAGKRMAAACETYADFDDV